MLRRPRSLPVATPWQIVAPAVAYLCAALLLILPFGDHPDFLYNWEDYALTRLFDFWDRPGVWIFDIDSGLMTDSGQSPLVTIPVWIAWKLEGVSLAAMRFPLMLISAGAVPLLWLAGRRIAGPLEGALAAALLALSPVFLFYGRTATNVALSLVPALLTIYVLIGLLREPSSRHRLLALQGLLLAGVYAYAPIRFLWLMALGLLAMELVLQHDQRRAFVVPLAVTTLSLPLFLVAASGRSPDYAISHYYWGRGEHLLALRENPDNLRSHMIQEIRVNPELATAGTDTLLRHKLQQNVRDLFNLLVDRNTRPALTDYWNSHGRLCPLILVPFVAVGAAVSLGRATHRPEYRALLIMTAGFTLPMVLTSNVHIGRLIFALPLLLLISAIGFTWTVRNLLTLARQPRQVQTTVAVITSSLLVIAFGWLSWQEYRGYTAPTRAWPWAATISASSLHQNERAAAYIAGHDPAFEEIEIATLRLALDDGYAFIDLRESPLEPSEPGITTIYYGQLLTSGTLATLGDRRCQLHYFTTTETMAPVIRALAGGTSPCPTLPEFTVLDQP